MLKRLCSIVLTLTTAILLVIPAYAVPPMPDIDAPSAILIEQSTGAVLFEKNAHDKLAPASVTKIMTLLLVMEALDSGRIGWDDTVIASDKAAAKGGSQVYLEAGEQMTMEEMLKSVVVSSANDCATALAEHIAGSEDAFVVMMNQRAAELGMADTHFVNCTGLDDSSDAAEHLTSAYDISLMSRQLLQHEEILDFTTIWMDSVRNGQFGLSNTNKLVRFYQGTTGLKTGFTSAAGYCLSASAQRDGIQFIAVVMNCKTSDQRFSSARAMLDYGFANYTLVSPDPDTRFSPIPVKLGKSDTVTPILADYSGILTAKSDAANVEQLISLPGELEAPVFPGQQLGQLTLRSGNQVLAQIPIVAADGIERLRWSDAVLKILKAICYG